MVTVVGFSSVPLLVANGGGTESPFLFTAGLSLGTGLGSALFLAVFFRSVLRSRSVLSLISRRLLSWSLFLVIVNQFVYSLFAWSTRYLDVSVAATLFETWPIFLIVLTAILYRYQARYHKITFSTIWLLVAGFIDFAFVTVSQTGGFGNSNDSEFIDTMIGLAIIVITALVASLPAFGFKWGTDLSESLPDEIVGERNPALMEVCCALVAFCIASFAGIGLNAGVGLSISETISVNSFAIAVVSGALVMAPASIAWRAANMVTDNLGINALSYATPIFSLAWLFLFAQVDVARVDFLLIGAAVIITANLLINLEAEIEFGFKALILALWACGAVVYLRPEEWVWVDSEGYFGVLGLSATLFTLILAFRVSRFVDRTSYEDNTMYSIFHTLDLLARRGVVTGQVRENMMSLDAARNIEDTYTAYGDIKLNLQSAQSTAQTPDDQQTLSQTEASLDSVIHSKQRGNNFGEFFALIVFAVITVAMALLARPEQSGWTGFLVEMFTFPFCAVIVFLTVNAWDVHRDWLAAVFSRDPESGWYGVLIRDDSNRDFEQWASVVIGLAVTVTYAFLLWDKWLG